MRQAIIIIVLCVALFCIFFFGFKVIGKNEQDKKDIKPVNTPVGKSTVQEATGSPNSSNSITAPQMNPKLRAAVDKKVAEYQNADDKVKADLLNLYTLDSERLSGKVGLRSYDVWLESKVVSELKTNPAVGGYVIEYLKQLNSYNIMLAKNYGTGQ